LKGLNWDESSNIVPSIFRKSVSALNTSATPVEIENALGQLNLLLDNEDLGKQFYEKITETSGLKIMPRGLICASLDLLSEDAGQSATAVQEFDRRLPDLFEKLRLGDMVMVTGGHGRDFSLPGRTSTREYVPVFVTGPKLAQGVDLGSRPTAADVGQTIVEALQAERLPVGESFLDALRPG
jgi:hypothetical protein